MHLICMAFFVRAVPILAVWAYRTVMLCFNYSLLDVRGYELYHLSARQCSVLIIAFQACGGVLFNVRLNYKIYHKNAVLLLLWVTKRSWVRGKALQILFYINIYFYFTQLFPAYELYHLSALLAVVACRTVMLCFNYNLLDVRGYCFLIHNYFFFSLKVSNLSL